MAADHHDVVVIGAGLVGVSVATFLARGGVDVVVTGDLDADLDPGFVELPVLEHPHRTLAALGPERTAELFSWSDRNRELLAAEGLFEPHPLPWVATHPREAPELAASARALASLGRAAEVRDHALGPALWLPDQGRLVPQATQTLAAGLRRIGGDATLVNTPGDVVVDVGGRRLTCEVAVIAAGAASGRVSEVLAGRITPIREQALRIGPVHAERGIGRAGQGWTHWSQRDSSVVVGGARWASPHLAVGEDSAEVDPKIQHALEAFAARLAPGAQVLERWAWVFASTPDGLPLIGPLPGDPRRVVCAGFGGSPRSLAMAAARAVADGLLTGSGETPWFLSSRRMVRWRS